MKCRSWIIILLSVILVVAVGIGGYAIGINHATTSEGWVDYHEDGTPVFVLEVDGNYYEWFIDEE